MRIWLWLVLISGLGLFAWSQEVPLIQPGELPPSLGGAVLSAIASLEEVLSDWRLGAGGAAVKLGWSDYQLARFVAGRLGQLGYPSMLARAGERWWVLSKVTAGGMEFWVPVVPGTLADAEAQGYQRGVFLGHVAWEAPGTFNEAYLEPEGVAPLPPNRPPRAVIRYTPSSPQPGERVRFLGNLCFDPDGVIVSFRWDFGDGGTSDAMNPAYTYEREGTYRVTLTVLDDAGAEATLTKTIQVYEPSSGNGCGCGG